MTAPGRTPHVTARVTILVLPLTESADGIPNLRGGMFVEREFAPSTEIEGLDIHEIDD